MILLIILASFCLGALEARPSLPINGQLNIFNPPDKRAISLAEFILQNPPLNVFNPPSKREVSRDVQDIFLTEALKEQLNLLDPLLVLSKKSVQPVLNIDWTKILEEILLLASRKREVSRDVQDIVLTEALKDQLNLLNPLIFISKKSVQPVFNINWTKILEEIPEIPLLLSKKNVININWTKWLEENPQLPLILSKKNLLPLVSANLTNWFLENPQLPLLLSKKNLLPLVSANLTKWFLENPQLPLLLSKKNLLPQVTANLTKWFLENSQLLLSKKNVFPVLNINLTKWLEENPQLPLLLSRSTEEKLIDVNTLLDSIDFSQWFSKKNVINIDWTKFLEENPQFPLLLSRKEIIDWKNLILNQIPLVLSRNSESAKRSSVDWASLLLPQTALVS